jgi:hypothetical protein
MHMVKDHEGDQVKRVGVWFCCSYASSPIRSGWRTGSSLFVDFGKPGESSNCNRFKIRLVCRKEDNKVIYVL